MNTFKHTYILFFILLLSCFSCSSSGHNETKSTSSGFKLPKELSLIQTDITAYLFTSLNPAEKTTLSYDASTQTFKGNFSVPIGSDFDLTIVYKTVDPISKNEVEIARTTRKKIIADGDKINLSYSEDDTSWETIFDLTPGVANELNLDGDPYSNFVEIAYGSNLLEAGSVPVGPSLSMTRRDPLFGELDLSLPPPDSDDASALSGEVDLLLAITTPFDVAAIEVINPSFGVTFTDSLETIKKNKTGHIKINTELYIYGRKDTLKVDIKVTDKHGISSVSSLAFAVRNVADTNPPKRITLGLTPHQVIVQPYTFTWELADGSGLDKTSLKAVISSVSQSVLVQLPLKDQDPTLSTHFLSTITIDPEDFLTGTDYVITFSGKDTDGHLYEESIPLEIQKNIANTTGAIPVIKFNDIYVSKLSSLPEADNLGNPNSIVLDGSLSTGPSTGGLSYAWGCSAPGGFSFTSTSAIAQLTLPNINRNQDGYVILCTLTVTQGSYQNAKQVPITLSFVNQLPNVNSVAITQKAATTPPLLTPDNWQINWQATDPDGDSDIVSYDVIFSKKNSADQLISTTTCSGITASSLSAGDTTQCLSTDKGSGELANPLRLGSLRDYTISVIAYDKSEGLHSKSILASVADTNLYGRWRFEGNLLDASGNGKIGSFFNDNDANLANNFAATGSTLFGQAITFDKSKKQYVTISNQFVLSVTDFTLSAWIKPTTFGQPQAILESIRNNTGYELMIGSNGHLIFYTPNCGSQTSNITTVANEWNHVVATRKSGRIKLFVNGNLTSTASCPGTLYSEGQLTLGCNTPDTTCTEPFDGQIDELIAFSKALSVDDIRRLCRANDPTGTTCPDIHQPIILQPAPNAILQPSRIYVSWRGEQDAAGVTLSNDSFAMTHEKYDNSASKYLSYDGQLITEGTTTDDISLATYGVLKETNDHRLSVSNQNTQVTHNVSFINSNALWTFQNTLADEFSLTNTFGINVGPVNFIDNESGGRGLDFTTRSNKYIASSNTAIFNQGTGDFSIAVYAKLNSIGNTLSLVEKRTPQVGFQFLIDQEGFLGFYIPNCPALGSVQKSAVSTTGYHYYGVTRKNGLLSLLIDGRIVDQGTCSANINSIGHFTVGCNSSEITCQEFFHGVFDELYTSSSIYSAEAQLNQYCALQSMSVVNPDDMPDVCLE